MAIRANKRPLSTAPKSGTIPLLITGALSGAASAVNSYAASDAVPTPADLWTTVGIFSIGGALGFIALRKLLRHLAAKIGADPAAVQRYSRADHWPYLIFLLSFLGAFGVRFGLLASGLMWLLFALWQGVWLARCMGREARQQAAASRSVLAGLFFLSGIAALIYQVAWQRLLFTLFGVNIESVTLIVSVFMFGLGVGAMVGGWLSQKFPGRLPELFLWIEIGIALFGFASVGLISAVGAAAAGSGPLATALVVYLLLFFPTLCMGATLPILVAYLHREEAGVGSAVGLLYTFNTAGSALACFLTAGLLFRVLGLTGAVWFAAACNLLTGWLVFLYCRRASAFKASSVRVSG